MRQFFFSLLSALAVLWTAPVFAQTYQLTVNNGYGSGQYAAGDSVHIWAAEYPNTQVFWAWAGQIEYLKDRAEWHTTLVMPAHDVAVTAFNRLMPFGSNLELEEIMGRDTLKRVFSWFPANPKGVVWFFHGTGGSASAWVNAYDSRQLVNQCMADTFAVMITECEETTKNADLNNDGNFKRWHFDPDTNNVDFANIEIIRQEFVSRGVIDDDTPNFGVGFSAGGAMSEILSWYFPQYWKAGVNCGTGGVEQAAMANTSPVMFSPNRRDDHPEVGPISVSEAAANSQMYVDRGVCSQIRVNEPAPLHPQRFQRRPGITAAQSQAIFDDLQNNNCLGPNHYLLLSHGQIEALVQNNPQNWPSIAVLDLQERLFVVDQLAILWSAHHFTPDFNGAVIQFLRNACYASVSQRPEPIPLTERLMITPNPASQMIHIGDDDPHGRVRIFDMTGRSVLSTTGSPVSVAHLNPGIYFVATEKGVGRFVIQH